MQLDIYNTHMELYPYAKDEIPVIEKMYTATDKFTGNEFACGYMIEDGKLYLPRGTHIAKIEAITGCKTTYKRESDESEKMSKQFYSLYDPRNNVQEESIKFLSGEEHQLGLNLATGLGKAQPVSTRIPTPYGYKYMGELQIGDEVFDIHGKLVKITGVFPQGKKDTYRITFYDGRTADCCKDHLWEVHHPYDTEERRVIDTETMLLMYKKYGYTYSIPVLDGPIEYEYQYINKREYGEPIELGKSIGYGTEYINGIPDLYLHNTVEIRMEILKGIMETTRFMYYENGTFYILDTITGSFRDNIAELVLGLGFQFKSTNIMKAVEKTTEYKIIHKYLRIKSLKRYSSEECVCIMVDSDRHLYVTSDYIVTHNTFCVAYTVTQLKEKAIIITPNESLKQQWINTFHKMFDYRPKNLMNISGSNVIDAIMEDMVDEADVYFVNHQTLRSYLTANNGYKLHQFFKKLNVGIKVYDESHMEFMNILLIDFFTNTNRTWYLTATFDRSDKTESACFKRAFSSVIGYGEIQSQEVVEKHVVYHVVNINSRISPKDRARVIGYAGMTGVSYGKYAFLEDKSETAYNAILEILKKVEHVEGKILIFIPLIEAVDLVVKKLRTDFSQKSVTAYHSKMSKDEKESIDKKDIIVSTIKSLGTGKDIKGLRCVICAEPVASKVVIQQVIGRLRPYGEGKDTYYFDLIDVCIPPCNYWWKARFRKIETLVKSIIYLNIEK